MATFSLVNVTGELQGGQKRVTILLGREIIFFLASLGAVMQLKCGSAALGIADHFNALDTEGEVLTFRILCGCVKMSAYSSWTPLPLVHLFSVPFILADTRKQCGVTESCPCLVRRSLELSVSKRGTKGEQEWETTRGEVDLD